MPNYVKPSGAVRTPFPTAAVDHASALKPTQEMSIFTRWKVGRKHDLAVANIEETKIRTMHEEAIATVSLAATMQGSLIRAELGRSHTDQLAAVGAAMTDSYKVIVLEQAASRQHGTLANMLARNEACTDAMARFQSGEFSQEQVEVVIHTADDLQAETEARIDAVHQQLADVTDRNIKAAMTPIDSTQFRR